MQTYALLSARRFFSFMTGDGRWKENGDNPTHMLPMVTYICVRSVALHWRQD